jgi:hypothetical protein
MRTLVSFVGAEGALDAEGASTVQSYKSKLQTIDLKQMPFDCFCVLQFVFVETLKLLQHGGEDLG